MTTEDALLAAILAAPDDDLRRLVYADHLEGELRQPERAEFIRVQCALDRHPARRLNPDATYGEYADLKQRERALFESHGWPFTSEDDQPPGWFDDLPAPGGQMRVLLPYQRDDSPFPQYTIRRGFPAIVRAPLTTLIGEVCERCGGRGYFFTRGPGNVGCEACGGLNTSRPLEHWRPYIVKPGTGRTPCILPDLVTRFPIDLVDVTDREPWGDVRCVFSWWSNCESEVDNERAMDSNLPAEIFTLLTGYREMSGHGESRTYSSATNARNALSRALLAFAKQTAAVPESSR